MRKKTVLKKYSITTAKYLGPKGIIRLIFMSDLHFHDAGDRKHAGEIIRIVKNSDPDIIIFGGDLIRALPDDDYGLFSPFFRILTEICPVYAVNGNYESNVKKQILRYGTAYQKYTRILGKFGVVELNDRTVSVSGFEDISISGYEVPLKYYKKFKKPDFDKNVFSDTMGRCDKKRFNILAAHNPVFGDYYFGWGADLILSGHNHGGLIRLGNRSLLSPYGYFLPKYGYGMYKSGEQTMIITAGAGESKVPVRINDPREIVEITIEHRD